MRIVVVAGGALVAATEVVTATEVGSVVVVVVVVVVGEGMHGWSFAIAIPGRSLLMRSTRMHVTDMHWRNDTDCSLG